MSTTTAPISSGNALNDYRVLGVISVGHFMSHFYALVLPPIFPELRAAFGASYTELGAVVALMMVATAVIQIPVGIWVDRYGARTMLTAGLALLSLTCLLSGLVGSFWLIAVLTVLGGAFNAVFHPADYSILNSSIAPERMGRSFSIHTFSGHLGSASTPLAMIALSNAVGWKAALVISGIVGLVITLLLTTQWNLMREDAVPAKKKATAGDHGWAGVRVLLTKPIMLFFMFFALLSMTAMGMQSFAVAALVTLHGTPLTTANAVLSTYLFCSAAGILIGGEIADRWPRHDLIAAIMFILTAVFSVMMALFDMPWLLLGTLMAIMGLGQGITRPARDMMLRDAAPPGAVGRIFGFVSSGLASGAALAPIPFGLVIDWGSPAWVFYLNAIFMLIALATVFIPKEIAPLAKPAT